MDNIKDITSEHAPTSLESKKEIIEPSYQTTYKDNFNQASEDYWRNKLGTYLNTYTAGVLTGKFGKADNTPSCYYSRLFYAIKNNILSQLVDRNMSLDDMKDILSSIECSFKMLGKALDKVKPNIDANHILSFMQGFGNEYISQLNIKEERKSNKTNE